MENKPETNKIKSFFRSLNENRKAVICGVILAAVFAVSIVLPLFLTDIKEEAPEAESVESGTAETMRKDETASAVVTKENVSGENDTESGTESDHVHEYSVADVKWATCTDFGYRVYTCSCGDTYSETIQPTGHSFTAPSCAAPAICVNCGATTGEKSKEHGVVHGRCPICGEIIHPAMITELYGVDTPIYDYFITDYDINTGDFTTSEEYYTFKNCWVDYNEEGYPVVHYTIDTTTVGYNPADLGAPSKMEFRVLVENLNTHKTTVRTHVTLVKMGGCQEDEFTLPYTDLPDCIIPIYDYEYKLNYSLTFISLYFDPSGKYETNLK